MASGSSGPAGPIERLQQLETIEREIGNSVQSAGLALQELSKEKPVMKQVETHTTQFMKTLEEVEKKLTMHINYLTQVSTGQPHEGSCYAAQRDLQLANHRIAHIKTRLDDLEKLHSVQNAHIPQRPPLTRGQSFEQI